MDREQIFLRAYDERPVKDTGRRPGAATPLTLSGAWFTIDLRMEYASHFASLTFAEIEEYNAGEQLSGLQNEISGVSAFLRADLFPIVNDLVKFICAFALDVQETKAENTTDMNAIVTCADSAILYDAQGFMLGRFEKSSLKLRKANMRIRRRAGSSKAYGGSFIKACL